jgi:DNA-binding SARP family transcriptional activator
LVLQDIDAAILIHARFQEGNFELLIGKVNPCAARTRSLLMDSESFVTENFLLAGRALIDPTFGVKMAAPKRRTRRGVPAKKNLGATVTICCLGYFSIRRAGEVPINIRMNTRPGALLQLLIAAGPNGIDKRQAENLLWPQSEGARIHGILDSTLYRLRKLLETDSACRAELGMIMLDGNVVSIDAWLFDREVNGILARLRRHSDDLDAGEIAIRSERLLELYRGPFMALEPPVPWIIKTRDQLQTKFVHAIKEVGNFWQASARWDRAAKLYEQVLERDNLAEDIYRELIRCHLARREYAEAIRVFNRCVDLLTQVLGVAPNEETAALYTQALRAQESDRQI